MKINKKGFSLVELLVVLVIIGVLVALILPNTLKAISQAEEKECASNIRTINTAVKMCYSDTRDWEECGDVDTLVQGDYMEIAPECPFGTDYDIVDADAGGKHVDGAEHFGEWPQITGGHE